MKITIEVSEATHRHIESLLASGEYASVDEYVDDLIRSDCEGDEPAWIHQFLKKRLDEIERSPSKEATPEYWAQMKQDLLRRVQDERGEVA